MTNLLTELLNAGLIEKLDGDDGLFSKIEQAAKAIAQELREQPPQLIRAILAGLDPDIADDDPIIVRSEQALLAEWKSVRTKFPDRPLNMLRAILLDACNQVSEEENNAAILWLTAADTLPLLRLGREESVVRKMLEAWARCAERNALAGLALTDIDAEQVKTVDLKFPKTTALEPPKINRKVLSEKMEGVVVNLQTNYGPTVSHTGFADRMHQLLADEFDRLAVKFSESQLVEIKEVQTYWVWLF